MIVNALLQWPGIDINAQEMNGNTALHYAAKLGGHYVSLSVYVCMYGCMYVWMDTQPQYDDWVDC